MKFLTFLIFFVLFSTFYFLFSNAVFAAINTEGDISTLLPSPPIKKLSNLGIESLVIWLIGIFWILAVGFIIWAAFTFLFADGDEGKVGEAKKRLLYAVIAAAVALLSTGIDMIVENLLT